MANAVIKAVLKECNTELIADLAPDPVISYFWVRGIISDWERDHVSTVSRSRMTQNAELLDLLRTKDNRALDTLISYVESEGYQRHLLNRLKESKERHSQGNPDVPVKPDLESDFPLTFPQVSTITSVLVEDPTILRDWGELKYKFIEKSMDIYEIENLTGKVSSQIRRTLEFWVSRRTDQATFENLLKILSKDYGNASNALKKEKKEIRSSKAGF